VERIVAVRRVHEGRSVRLLMCPCSGQRRQENDVFVEVEVLHACDEHPFSADSILELDPEDQVVLVLPDYLRVDDGL